MFWSEPGRATLRLLDRDTGFVAFYASDSFRSAVEGLEASLQAGKVDWRVDKRKHGG